MTAASFAQMALNGLMLGVSLLLVALGFQLIIGVMRIVNFAHGELYMLGAFGVWYLAQRQDLNYWLAILVSVVLVCIVGVLLERYFLRQLRGRLLPQMVITFGFVLIFQTLALLVFGTEGKAVSSVFRGAVAIGGAKLSAERLAVSLISLVIAGVTLALWRWTKAGRAIRAMAQEPDGARLQGVSLPATCRLTMIVATALAAIGGGLLAPVFMVEPYMGLPVILKSLVVIAVAGMGSMGGTVIAALVLGVVESFATTLASSEVAAMVYLVILALILLLRPSGFFGHELELE